jgi:O-methyltransferase domain/Dimerisation domain
MTASQDAHLRDLLNGFQASEALHAAVELGLPETLASGSLHLEVLAQATRTLPDRLGRLLRVLVALDVVLRDADGRYALTAMGQRLCPGVEGNWNAWARMIGSPAIRKSWSRLAETIRVGTTGFKLAHGADIWTYRAQHPEDGKLFDAAMRSGTERLAEAVAQCLGELADQHVVDVGGGDGSLLAHLLLKNPAATGSLLEQGAATQRAGELLGLHGLQDRTRIVEGDFFNAVPPNGHIYLLKFVLHDWEDEQAVRILRTCRAAVDTTGSTASLVLIERLLDAPHGSREASLADLNMLVNTGGRERSRQEFATLLDRAGLALSSCQFASGSLTVMQAKPQQFLG